MTSESNSDVIVVGGGVVGLTTAVVLAESGSRVRVWAREPGERATSGVAGGLWWPYRIEPEERVGAWALDSLAVYEAAGFVGAQADQAAAAVFTYVLGNAAGTAATASLTRKLGREGADAQEQFEAVTAKAQDVARRFPRLAARLDTAAAVDYAAAPEKAFEFGLRALLDGLERQRPA